IPEAASTILPLQLPIRVLPSACSARHPPFRSLNRVGGTEPSRETQIVRHFGRAAEASRGERGARAEKRPIPEAVPIAGRAVLRDLRGPRVTPAVPAPQDPLDANSAT